MTGAESRRRPSNRAPPAAAAEGADKPGHKDDPRSVPVNRAGFDGGSGRKRAPHSPSTSGPGSGAGRVRPPPNGGAASAGLRRWLRRMLLWVGRRVPPGLRLWVGFVLMIGGMLGFLPVLGFWMIPLGLAIAALDIRPLARAWRRAGSRGHISGGPAGKAGRSDDAAERGQDRGDGGTRPPGS